jgi:hypothetical protein
MQGEKSFLESYQYHQTREKKMATKFKIIEDAKRQIRSCFLGIAVPHQPSLADGEYGPIRSEKVIKFNKTALRNMGKMKKEKVDPRLVGGSDLMKHKVGKPGSKERVEALRSMYEMYAVAGQEISAFHEE